jgi:hypothetical protein
VAAAAEPPIEQKQAAGGSGSREVERHAARHTPDLDALLASASDASPASSGGDGGGSSESEGLAVEPAVPVPAGVILVDSATDRNAEVQRLLRAPR